MKSLRYFASSFVMLMAGMFTIQPLAFAADTTKPATPPAATVAPATQPIATTQPLDPRIAEAVRNIQNAPDPSSVVEAYAAARAVAPDSVPVGQAYMARLVALGVPEMAESQARDITRRAPDDGLAWAVAAFMDARRDGMRAALEEIAIAAKKAPADPFVQRTAGQLIAYHDRDQREESYPDSLEATVAETRGALSGKTDFDMAYRASSQAYAQRPTSSPVSIGRYTYTPPTDTYDSGGPYVTYNDNYGGYSQPYYTNPYMYDSAPYYGLYGSYYYSPFYYHRFGFNDFRFHSRFDHHDFDHRRDFDHHDDHHDADRSNFRNDRFTRPGFRDTGRSFDGRTGNWNGSRDAGMIPRGGSSIDRGDRYIGGGVNSGGGSSGRSGNMGGAGSSGSRGGGMSGSSGARGGGGGGSSGGASGGSGSSGGGGGGGHR